VGVFLLKHSVYTAHLFYAVHCATHNLTIHSSPVHFPFDSGSFFLSWKSLFIIHREWCMMVKRQQLMDVCWLASHVRRITTTSSIRQPTTRYQLYTAFFCGWIWSYG